MIKKLFLILYLIVIPFLLVSENFGSRSNLLYEGYLEDYGIFAGTKVPNPFGKAGGPLHQGKIQEVLTNLKQQGYKFITFESPVKTPGGFKNMRYGDILMKSPTGKNVIIQVGKQTSGGFPISRELKAIQDLESVGYKVQFYPYNQ